MRKKVRRVSYYLDSKNIESLPFIEICAIIGAADDIIGMGGRTLLSKILRGSKDKKIIELGLDKIPVYGYFKDTKKEEISAKIDWAIENDYLRIEYDYRLPLIYFTDKGWEIAKGARIEEFIQTFDEMLDSEADQYNMTFLKDRNREMILQLLDTIREKGDKKYVPILEDWAKVDYKKVREKINYVISCLDKDSKD